MSSEKPDRRLLLGVALASGAVGFGLHRLLARPPAAPEAPGISFAEAQSVFRDPLAQARYVPPGERDGPREILLGRSAEGRLLVVGFTERREDIRLTSAREATRREQLAYDIRGPAKPGEGWMGSALAPEYAMDSEEARPNRFAPPAVPG